MSFIMHTFLHTSKTIRKEKLSKIGLKKKKKSENFTRIWDAKSKI